MRRTRKAIGTLAAATSMAMAMGGVAAADTLQDNVLEAEGGKVALTAGSSTGGTAKVQVNQQQNDGDAGCNIDANEKITVAMSVPTGVTASPSSFDILGCGGSNGVTVTFTAGSNAVSGNATASITFNNTGNGIFVNDVLIPIEVTRPNTAPTVSVTGVTHNGSYEAGSVPAPGCQVHDTEDGPSTPAAVITGTLNAEGVGARKATCTYTDNGGLSASAFADYSIVDTTAPALSGVSGNITREATSAAGADVTWAAPTATGRTGETTSTSCSPASGSSFGLGTTPVSCTASDGTGNTSAAQTFNVTVRDTTAPALSDMPSNQVLTATSSAGAVATWSAPTATDLVDAAASTSCSADSGTTFGLGTTTVSCTASDAAGNESAAQSFTVNVTYSATGALQPINTNGSSIFKLGSTVPVKFALSGASAGIADAVATIKVARVSAGIAGSESEAVSSTTSSSGSTFRYDSTSGQYIFNYGTKALAEGTYQIRFDLGDGVGTRAVNISLKK